MTSRLIGIDELEEEELINVNWRWRAQDRAMFGQEESDGLGAISSRNPLGHHLTCWPLKRPSKPQPADLVAERRRRARSQTSRSRRVGGSGMASCIRADA